MTNALSVLDTPQAVPCPLCKVSAGEPCIWKTKWARAGEKYQWHQQRKNRLADTRRRERAHANNNRVYGNLKITSIIKKGKPNRYQLIQVGEVPTTERGVSAGVSAGGGVSSPSGYTVFAGVSSLNA